MRTVFAFSLQICSPEGMHSCCTLFLFFIFNNIPTLNTYSLIPLISYVLRSGSWTGGDGAWVELSGKMHVLARLLAHLRKKTDDRIVLVSNYTQVNIDPRLHMYVCIVMLLDACPFLCEGSTWFSQINHSWHQSGFLYCYKITL